MSVLILNAPNFKQTFGIIKKIKIIYAYTQYTLTHATVSASTISQ